MPVVLVRLLLAHEWSTAYPIIAELRSHLSSEEFIARVVAQLPAGYELIGAFDGELLLGVMGMRPVHTLARGAHLHIDDLVVTRSARRLRIGTSLLDYAIDQASARGLRAVFLDARQDAVAFYTANGFDFHSAALMKKRA